MMHLLGSVCDVLRILWRWLYARFDAVILGVAATFIVASAVWLNSPKPLLTLKLNHLNFEQSQQLMVATSSPLSQKSLVMSENLAVASDNLEADKPYHSKPKKARHKSKLAKKAKPPVRSISLNKATSADLEKLPGIGPKLARRILDYRGQSGPFQTLEQLKEVKGIGDKNFEKLLPYLKL